MCVCVCTTYYKVFKRQTKPVLISQAAAVCCCLIACKSPALLVIIMLLARIEAKCRGGLHAFPIALLTLLKISLTRSTQSGVSKIVN